MQPIIIPALLLSLAGFAAAAGKIIHPWHATTAIVTAGAAFEVWFDAAPGQVVESACLRGPHHSVGIPALTGEAGKWTYDPVAGNTYNTRLTASVPAGTPTDRYDLVLNTTAGEVESIRAVRVIAEPKTDYKVLHISDSHLREGMGHQRGLLEKKHTAIVNMANIINPELVFVTGDNITIGRDFQQRLDHFYRGSEAHGFKGMHDFNAACFVVAGNHDHGFGPYEGEHEEKARFWNEHHGLQSHGFKYGNGRFMLYEELGNDPDDRRWKLNLTLDHARPNDGSSAENTATLANHFDFAIPGARVRFVMRKGAAYTISAGAIEQAFDGDAAHIVDVNIDLPPRATTTVRVTAK